MITYITINMSEIALVDFNQVMETSEQTLRLSVDGLQSSIKMGRCRTFICINIKFVRRTVYPRRNFSNNGYSRMESANTNTTRIIWDHL